MTHSHMRRLIHTWQMNESCHTCQLIYLWHVNSYTCQLIHLWRDMTHSSVTWPVQCTSHVTHEWVMSRHRWMSHVTENLLHNAVAFGAGMSGIWFIHTWVWYDSFIHDMTFFYKKGLYNVRPHTQSETHCLCKHLAATWLFKMNLYRKEALIVRELGMSAIWLIHMCDMTHSYVWHDAFICVTWLIHMCDMTHSYVWHDAFICVTWLIHMCDMTFHLCDMTHSYVWHDSFICVTWLMQWKSRGAMR